MGTSETVKRINPLLGRTADITVNRKLGCRNIRHRNVNYSVNIGYFELEKDLGDRKHTVYIIGASNTSDTFKGRIISVIKRLDSGKLFAVAVPDGKRYYEPEIMECLNFFERQYVSEYEFYFEKQCAAIAFKNDGGERRYLLVKDKNTGLTGFPCIPAQFGESEQESSLRAVIQKSGIAADTDPGFRTEYTVTASNGAKKTTVFYTAEYKGSMPRPADDDVSDIYIMTFHEAIRKLDCPQDRIVLAEAQDYYELKEKSNFGMQ